MFTPRLPVKAIGNLILPLIILTGSSLTIPVMGNSSPAEQSPPPLAKAEVEIDLRANTQLHPELLLAYSSLRPRQHTQNWGIHTNAPFYLHSQDQSGLYPPLDKTPTASLKPSLTQQRDLYSQAIAAIYAGKKEQINTIRAELADYPLLPYLKYHELRRTISAVSPQEIDDYIIANPDLPVAKFLKTRKLFSLAKAEKWNAFLDYYTPSTDIRLNCYYQQALLNTQAKISNPDEIKKLWLVGKSQPKSCNKIFQAWLNSEYFNPSYAWERYILALENGRPSLAKYLIKHLPKADKETAKLGVALYKHPEKIKHLAASDNYKQRDIILIALSRLIYKNPEKAGQLIPLLSKKHKLDDVKVAAHHEKLATILAVRFHPEAEKWLEIANKEKTKPLLNELEIRTALRNLDWEKAYKKINALAPDILNSDRWQYWQARTLKQIENSGVVTSEDTYKALAKKRGFYGFMARDGAAANSEIAPPPKINNSQKIAISNQINVRRAYEFHLLGQHTNARREWHYAMQLFKPEQRLIAAEIAQEWNGPGLSIRAANSASPHNNFDLRFPMGYSEVVSKYAKKNQLDEDLVFALIRQESLFTPDARSHAGALGMMQLLPATAKNVARRNNISYRGSRDLLNPRKNIHLGTTYLKQLVQKFDDNEVLAMAAYNAGPHRVIKWIPQEKPLPLDVWIETIPFKETRNYVKHLLSNQDIYREKLSSNFSRQPFHKMINPS